MPKINGERLLADQRRLAEFGKYKTGVHRPTYSPQDMAARTWLVEQLAAAGLDASIDGIGNILARPRKPGPRLLIGSHSESQNHAGWLDGGRRDNNRSHFVLPYSSTLARLLSRRLSSPLSAKLGRCLAVNSVGRDHHAVVSSGLLQGDIPVEQIAQHGRGIAL
jgi:hypothetical protein